MNEENNIIIYSGADKKIHLEVTLKDESIWLNLNQLAELFGRDKSVISRHVSSVFKEKELTKYSVVAKIATTAADGKTYQVEYYSLDAIISVGYRVNSKRATQFRVWATGVLRDHILKGYTVNEKRLKESRTIKLKELERTVSLLQNVIRSKSLSAGEAQGLLSVITDYANSWILLQQYDAGNLKTQRGRTKSITPLFIDEVLGAIVALKTHLAKKKEGSDIFAVERQSGSIEGILNSIRQSFAGRELYPSIEEKGAHLLYFIIKQHPLVDGNKRVASLLFILFLSKNNYLFRKDGERKINDNTLVALALLIAESKPSEKEVMISLVTNLLV